MNTKRASTGDGPGRAAARAQLLSLLRDSAPFSTRMTRVDVHGRLHRDEGAGHDVLRAEELACRHGGERIDILARLCVLFLQHILHVLAPDELDLFAERSVILMHAMPRPRSS